jgi:hypothetical protein
MHNDHLLSGLLDLGNQLFDDGRFSQGTEISELVFLLVDNLSQDPPHDLARPRLGQVTHNINLLGSSKWSNDLADLEDQLFRQFAFTLHIELAKELTHVSLVQSMY